MNKKYYVALQRRVSDRVIERAYEGHPDPNADGLIDFYKDIIGEYESLAGLQVDSYEEAEQYFDRHFPTIRREDETRIIIREMK
jgi:hypothetical protein